MVTRVAFSQSLFQLFYFADAFAVVSVFNNCVVLFSVRLRYSSFPYTSPIINSSKKTKSETEVFMGELIRICIYSFICTLLSLKENKPSSLRNGRHFLANHTHLFGRLLISLQQQNAMCITFYIWTLCMKNKQKYFNFNS